MKNCFLLFCILLSAFGIQAQDQLFKKDNTKLLVKIIEVGSDDVQYKMFNNLNGPVYYLSKNEISMIIYENGKHEVMQSDNTNSPPLVSSVKSNRYKADSSLYFKYSNSISVNFLNFINNEFGFIYQREFYKKNYNLIIPFSIGYGSPLATESVYFSDYHYYQNNYSYITLNRKLFEFGIGLNYYSSLKRSVNYYAGPLIKFMQYSAQEVFTYYPTAGVSNYYNVLEQTTTLNRFTASITNGLMCRTKTGLVFNLFGSLGIKYDKLSDLLTDPISKTQIDPITVPIQFYFWGGTSIGFCF